MSKVDQPAAPKIEQWPLEKLVPYERNARTHSEDQVLRLAEVIRKYGWTSPIVVDGKSKEIIAGHGRMGAAKVLGLTRVPVLVRSDLTPDQVRALRIADNRLAEQAGWDEDLLARELLELEQGSRGTAELLGFDQDEFSELARLVLGTGAETGPAEAGPDDPPEDPVSQPGDLWLMGGHRILCGDSTKPEDVRRLMGKEKATLLATDPPYLVDYDGTNHPADHHKKAGRVAAKGKEVGNKHWDAYVDPKSSVVFFSTFLRLALEHCIPRVPIYQWHATRRQVLVEQAWIENKLLVHQTIIWVKPRPVLTRSHFLWQHEPCFYGWIEGNMPDKAQRPTTTATTVWHVDSAGEDRDLHPTLKPLEIFERPIGWHTRPGAVVMEPFSGGGTQLVAAERLGRRCFAMELSPPFVDVAVRRWQKASGKLATLDGSKGQTFEKVARSRGKEVA